MIGLIETRLEGVIGVMIPIVAIVGGISLAMGTIYLKSRERMEMISRGMDVSQFDEPKRKRTRNPLRSGLMVFSAGVGLLLAYYLCHTVFTGDDNGIIYFGVVALFVGVGMIVGQLLEKKDPVQ